MEDVYTNIAVLMLSHAFI